MSVNQREKEDSSQSFNDFLLDIDELSRRLGTKKPTIYGWVYRHAIPCYKINGLVRFSGEDIDAWLETKRQEPYQVKKLLDKS